MQLKTKKEFLADITHPRKLELAKMIFADATQEEMLEAGFGEINAKEMCTKIAADVDGKYTPSCGICVKGSSTSGAEGEGDSLAALPVPKLKEMAKNLGLAVGGVKKELLARIKGHNDSK